MVSYNCGPDTDTAFPPRSPLSSGIVKLAQPGACPVRVVVVELFEQVQGLLPALAGGVKLAGGVLGVTEEPERVGLGIAVATVAVQLERLFVADDRVVGV